MRAYLSSVKRAPQALLSHWPFTEQQRGEGQEKIDALTELFSQFFFLWLNLLFLILLICSSITGWQGLTQKKLLHVTFYLRLLEYSKNHDPSFGD